MQFLVKEKIVFLLSVESLVFSLVSSGVGNDQLVVPDTAYYLKVYNAINLYRSKHVSPSLKWNRTLNEIAENLAIHLVRDPSSQIDPDDFEGVNYYGVPGGRPSASFVVGKWYNESILYDYEHPGYNANYLNFTQTIWKNTSGVGIGGATFRNFSVVVAQFSPSGNVKGRFRLNVIPPRL